MDITKIYGTMAFTDAVMSERLPRDVYESLKLTQRMGTELDSSIAGAVAADRNTAAVDAQRTAVLPNILQRTAAVLKRHRKRR